MLYFVFFKEIYSVMFIFFSFDNVNAYMQFIDFVNNQGLSISIFKKKIKLKKQLANSLILKTLKVPPSFFTIY